MVHEFILAPKYTLVPQFTAETALDVVPSSAVFEVPGHAASINHPQENTVQDARVFSKYFIHASTLNGAKKSLQLTYSPFNIAMIKRGLLEPNGAGTVEESLCFIEQTRVGGTLQYRKSTGCVCVSQSGQINRSGFNMTQNYECSKVEDWGATHGLSGTPSFVTKGGISTAEAWNHLMGGTNPCKINTVVTPVNDFRWDVTWTLAYADPNGTLTYIDAEIALGEINITLSSWIKDNTWKDLQENYTEFDVEYTFTQGLGAGNNHKVLFQRCKAPTYNPQSNAGQAQYAPHTLNAKCLGGVVVTTT
jgi:hypothetical protein